MLVGNEEDLQMGRSVHGPKVEGPAKSKLDPSTFCGMMDRVIEKYPPVTIRGDHVARNASHSWSAVA